MRVLVAEDHPMFRDGLAALLAGAAEVVDVVTAASGTQALAAADEAPPDVAVVDLGLPDGDGVWLTGALLEGHPATRVLVLTSADDQRSVRDALAAGAHGYLLKDTTANELEHALLALRNNERYLSPAIAHTVINQALVRSQGPTTPAGHSHNLTARQLEILRLIVRGKSTREIAHGLGLSIKTVEAHRSQIMKRLQIFDVAGLVLFAVREQIISLDD